MEEKVETDQDNIDPNITIKEINKLIPYINDRICSFRIIVHKLERCFKNNKISIDMLRNEISAIKNDNQNIISYKDNYEYQLNQINLESYNNHIDNNKIINLQNKLDDSIKNIKIQNIKYLLDNLAQNNNINNLNNIINIYGIINIGTIIICFCYFYYSK